MKKYTVRVTSTETGKAKRQRMSEFDAMMFWLSNHTRDDVIVDVYDRYKNYVSDTWADAEEVA